MDTVFCFYRLGVIDVACVVKDRRLENAELLATCSDLLQTRLKSNFIFFVSEIPYKIRTTLLYDHL